MKYSSFLIFSALFLLMSCNNEIHRDGTVLSYIHSGDNLYLVYQDNGKNHILSASLEPLETKWEREIAGDTDAPEIRIFENYIATNCSEGTVCLLSADDGKKVIEFDSNLIFRNAAPGFAFNNGKIYSLCGGSAICSYSIDSDEPLWTYELSENEHVTVEFRIENGFLIFGSSENSIKALSVKDGTLKWKSMELPELAGIYSFPETVLADYEFVNGLSISTGEPKWLVPYEGKVRCILDGAVIAQSEDYFSVLYTENGQKIWEYPRNGTTILACEEDLNLAAFTVKNYSAMIDQDSEYFDKIYIFNVSSGEKVFETNSDSEHTVLNLTGFNENGFFIAKREKDGGGLVSIEKYSAEKFELEKTFEFILTDPDENIYVSWIHSDPSFTVIRRSDIDDTADETNYLFSNEPPALMGELESVPEIITSTKAYDIISYDDYFNVVEKNLDDFLK